MKISRVFRLFVSALTLTLLVSMMVAYSHRGKVGASPPPRIGETVSLSEAIYQPEHRSVTKLVDWLDYLYYDSANLDHPALYVAALEGVQTELKDRGVSWEFEKPDPWATRSDAQESFEREFDKALEAGKSAKDLGQHDLSFAAENALLKSLGRSHCYFMYPPGHPKGFPISGSFVGIGAAIGAMEDGTLYFSKIFHGSPAEKAGLLAFDRPVSVDGKPVPKDATALAGMVRGKKGTKVRLTIERQGKRLDFEIERDTVNPPTADGRIVEDGKYHWAVLELSGFEDDDYKELKNVIKELEVFGSGVDGIIFDIRGNHGGSLEIMRLCLSWFLPKDTGICVMENQYGRSAIYTGHKGPATDKPVVVLIDGESASASEIFSEVMQEYQRATIIGKKSAGAVEVGNFIPMDNDAEVMITIAQVYTPSGKILEKVGVTPDIVLGLTDKDVVAGKDPDVEKALEVLKSKIEGK